MDFESITLKTPHKQRIVIEIDILGDEVDLDKYQKIADRLTDLLCQDSWLANPPEKLTFNTKVSLQLLPRKTHDQVQLPCTTRNERVTDAIARGNRSFRMNQYETCTKLSATTMKIRLGKNENE